MKVSEAVLPVVLKNIPQELPPAALKALLAWLLCPADFHPAAHDINRLSGIQAPGKAMQALLDNGILIISRPRHGKLVTQYALAMHMLVSAAPEPDHRLLASIYTPEQLAAQRSVHSRYGIESTAAAIKQDQDILASGFAVGPEVAGAI